MKLINRSLTVLVFINAVYSAVMREGNEDLLRFLKDAFEMNLAPDHTEPTQLSEMVLATERFLDPLHPTDPTEECKASETVVISADFSNTTPEPNLVEPTDFSNTTPEPNLVEPSDVAEERSIESSSSDSKLAERASSEDSREGDNYKRLQLRTALTDTLLSTDTHKALQGHYGNSAVMENISSQEMDRPEENGRNRPPRIKKMLKKHNAAVADTGRENMDFMKEINPIIQSFARRMNLKDQAGKPHDADKHQQESHKRAMDLDSPEFVDSPDSPDVEADSEERGGGHGRSQRQSSGIKAKLYAATTLDNSRELADLIPGCTQTSVEHPMEENNSLDAPNVDQDIQKDTMSYMNQLRKICPTKSVRASNDPRAQLDLDSPERVNSEALDRDNSSERLEDQVAVPL